MYINALIWCRPTTKEVDVSNISGMSYPLQPAAKERLESVQMVSFHPFVNMTRGYAGAIAKLAPHAAELIHSSAARWHVEWDAVVSPCGEYVALDQAAALAQLDKMESFIDDICDSLSAAYSAERVYEIRVACETALRKHRTLYLSHYERLAQEFNELADTVNNLLIDAFSGKITKSDALSKIAAIQMEHAPRE